MDHSVSASTPEPNAIAPEPTPRLASQQPKALPRLPNQRWQIAEAQPNQAAELAQRVELSPLLAQVLINRGVDTLEQAHSFLNPETDLLPSPLEEFTDLPAALELLMWAIANQHYIAICGDYDADGMTSTALLLRALRFLGAQVDYAIPSRMNEGYGINTRIVEDFHREGVRLILTVDNGIAAYEPIARARELGLAVIVTDHHDIPEQLPPANAILNPKLIREESPYRGVAGVGVAYILAVCLAQCLKKTQDLTTPLIELFTLGTIADLAPLTGVNRRWVRRGLRLLPKSRLAGVQALIQVAGLSNEREALKPEAIGFRLGPRINAVGRIADPQLVIELLTTNDEGQALELAMKCEQVNQLRQRLCELIEQEAIAWCETSGVNVQQDQVVVVVQPEWHHGVIGIVASRLVERYGVPVFIGTYEDEEQTHIRGSARGIPEFHVFEALQFCGDLLEKFGGHRAAGGFSFQASNLAELRSRLRIFAAMRLQPHHLKPLVNIDTQATFADLDLDLYEQINHLHPCGMDNPDPVFWTPNVRVLEQQIIGRDRTHLKVTLAQENTTIKAIAWRWAEYCPLPKRVDVAYRLRVNEWNGNKSVELELVGVRSPEVLQDGTQLSISGPTHLRDEIAAISSATAVGTVPDSTTSNKSIEGATAESEATADSEITDAIFNQAALKRVEFYFNNRKYTCSLSTTGEQRELRIRNPDGQVLAVQPHQPQGLLGKRREDAQPVDISQPFYFNLIRAALSALEITDKDELLKKKDHLISEKNQQIINLKQQLRLLNQLFNQQDSLPIEQKQEFQMLQNSLEEKTAAVQTQEVAIAHLQAQLQPKKAKPNPETIKQTLKSQLGDGVWYCIDQRSQNDLYMADKCREMLQVEAFTARGVDYSEAGLRLALAIEREVLQSFLKALREFLFTQLGVHNIAGIELGDAKQLSQGANRQQYTSSLLPGLIATQWTAFREHALQKSDRPLEKNLYFVVLAEDAAPEVTEGDRATVHTFLQQWEHPLADWLLHSDEAAKAIAQIAQLCDLAVNSEELLYEWQFEQLRLLMIGNATQRGILQEIYSPRRLAP